MLAKNTPKPPGYLKPETSEWFRSVVADYELQSHACSRWRRKVGIAASRHARSWKRKASPFLVERAPRHTPRSASNVTPGSHLRD